MSSPPVLGVLQPQWPAPANVRIAISTRLGGVSQPPFDRLNVGAHVGDHPQAVMHNRQCLRELAGLPGDPCWLAQVHGTTVADLDQPAPLLQADAAFTRRPARVCAVMTADCLPVLVCSKDGEVVGGAHAGWRGLAAGVLEALINATAVPGGRLLAYLGPAISQAHFEVGEEVREAFCAQDPDAAEAFVANAGGRWQADLYQLARQRLRALGVQDIYGGDACTYAQAKRFFSHRRQAPCGRMVSLIWKAS